MPHRLLRMRVVLALMLGCALLSPSWVAAQDINEMSPEERRQAIVRSQAWLSSLVNQVIRDNPDFLEQRAQYNEALDQAVDEILPSAAEHRKWLSELGQAYNAMLPNGDRAEMDRLFEAGKTLAKPLWEARIEARR